MSAHTSEARSSSKLDLRLAPDAWVFPDHKIVWVSVAKNACTSLKWMFADLIGEDPEVIYQSHRAEISRRMCIHDRGIWRHVRKPSDLSEEERASVRVENGWFIFSVVRDPRVRIWSAWQSKFLQRDPIYMRLFKDAAWLPRLPESAQDVIEDFAKFSEWIATHPKDKIHRDPHFVSQVWRIDRQTVPFSKIYEMSELRTLTSDLQDHLKRIGSPGKIHLSRDNDTSLEVTGELFRHGVREQLESVCREDLERFGSLWDFDKTMQREAVWSDEALRSIAIRAAMGERIRDLTDASNKYRRRAQRRNEEITSLRARVEQLENASKPGRSEPPTRTGQPPEPARETTGARAGASSNFTRQTLDLAKSIGQRLRRHD